MKQNITIFIECLAFLGLICCFFIYNANLLFLETLIAFVLCEIIIECFTMKFKLFVSYIYSALVLISFIRATIMVNGFHLSSFFSLFFVVILLVISHFSYLVEPHNTLYKEKHEYSA
jgi:hypothetical protein